MRIAADGYIDVRDPRRVRTPGYHESHTEPMPLDEALEFLLSHSFPGHRRIVRPPTRRELCLLRVASWASSVNERMDLVDRVWRAITTPLPPPEEGEGPVLVQIVRVGARWVYPLYLDDGVTRVIPQGGLPVGKLRARFGAPLMDMPARQTA